MKSDFEAQKQALLGEIRTVLDEVENWYQAGAERSAEETQALKTCLQARLGVAQSRLQKLETHAVEQVKQQAQRVDEYINEKPYCAMGFAALAGLVVGVLLNRK